MPYVQTKSIEAAIALWNDEFEVWAERNKPNKRYRKLSFRIFKDDYCSDPLNPPYKHTVGSFDWKTKKGYELDKWFNAEVADNAPSLFALAFIQTVFWLSLSLQDFVVDRFALIVAGVAVLGFVNLFLVRDIKKMLVFLAGEFVLVLNTRDTKKSDDIEPICNLLLYTTTVLLVLNSFDKLKPSVASFVWLEWFAFFVAVGVLRLVGNVPIPFPSFLIILGELNTFCLLMASILSIGAFLHSSNVHWFWFFYMIFGFMGISLTSVFSMYQYQMDHAMSTRAKEQYLAQLILLSIGIGFAVFAAFNFFMDKFVNEKQQEEKKEEDEKQKEEAEKEKNDLETPLIDRIL